MQLSKQNGSSIKDQDITDVIISKIYKNEELKINIKFKKKRKKKKF